MSKPLIYDSLLVHYLARELHDRLRGRRLRAVRLDSDARRFVLELDQQRLVWELHASRGWLRSIPVPDDDVPNDASTSDQRSAAARAAAEGWGGRKVRTQRRPRIRRVTAPDDERIIEIEIDAGGADRASRFVVELMTNQWNVLALEPTGRIVSTLWSREAGGRVLRSGVAYEPPAALEPRKGLEAPVSEERFAELVEADGARDRTVIRALAWISTLNVGPILAPLAAGSTPDDAAIAQAYARYRAIAALPEPEPRVLSLRGGTPYPLPLPGVDDEPAASLLDAFASLADREAPAGLAPEVRAALEDRSARAARKARSLREQLEAAPGKAAELRARADLLMARLHEVPRGASSVELEDFEGGTRTLELDPSLSAVENAEALYDRARRRERAAARLPDRVREAEAERDRVQSLLRSLEEGTADPGDAARWVAEVRPTEAGGQDQAERLPYRSFRSSGGLEIRVGRNGRANDDLTFHHSTPDDIWLHARDVAGAHVILRWGDRHQNPPQRDLMEAAVLAAVNSRARTSGTVPVDWTRRKYVRSPRNAAPGAVIPDRVATLFVEPDPDVEERLRQ